MLVIATGVNSLNGRTMAALEVEQVDTPLQIKLGNVADLIAKVSIIIASITVIVLIIIYFISNQPLGDGNNIASDMILLLILAVTIVVVAVPQCLPLAVTLALALAFVQMLKDQNLVRNLSACETMGNY